MSYPTRTVGRPGVQAKTVGGGTVSIAVPVMALSREDIITQWSAAAEAGADIIEWRVDGLVEPDIENLGIRLRDMYDIPVLVTVRSKAEGGRFPHRDSGGEYGRLIRQAAHWSDSVDIEIEAAGAQQLIEEAQDLGALVVASMHEFDTPPDSEAMRSILTQMADLGADIAKIAWWVDTPEQVAAVTEVQKWAPLSLGIPSVVLGMGPAAGPSRSREVAGHNAFVFAHAGFPSADGQPNVRDLR